MVARLPFRIDIGNGSASHFFFVKISSMRPHFAFWYS